MTVKTFLINAKNTGDGLPAEFDHFANQIHKGYLLRFDREIIIENIIDRVRFHLKKENLNQTTSQNIESFIETAGKIRSRIYRDLKIDRLKKELLWKLNLKESYCDLLRFRIVPAGFQSHPGTKPLSLIHRDSWYANPLSQINLWLPVYDVTIENTFALYTDYFKKPIKNNSHLFDYEKFKSLGGFQANPRKYMNGILQTGQHYPSAIIQPSGEVVKPAVKAGNVFVFSGSHLHGTLPNISNLNRMTLEWRIVRKIDIENDPVMNVDTFCKGSTLQDYTDLFNN